MSVVMFCVGMVGLLASYGGWWMMARYGAPLGESEDARTRCTAHCGGLDGTYLVGFMISGLVAFVGASLFVTHIGPPAGDPVEHRAPVEPVHHVSGVA